MHLITYGEIVDMIQTLIGQSEALTLSGTALIINKFNVLGGILLGLGVLGGICKFVINFQLTHQEDSKKEVNNDYEKLLSEALQAATQKKSS